MKNRIGKIEISRALIETTPGIFSEMNPIHIEEEQWGVIIYTCLSKHFDEVQEGEEIPFYECEIIEVTNKEDKERQYVYRFERQ